MTSQNFSITHSAIVMTFSVGSSRSIASIRSIRSLPSSSLSLVNEGDWEKYMTSRSQSASRGHSMSPHESSMLVELYRGSTDWASSVPCDASTSRKKSGVGSPTNTDSSSSMFSLCCA